jgi:hypothetical protein
MMIFFKNDVTVPSEKFTMRDAMFVQSAWNFMHRIGTLVRYYNSVQTDECLFNI